jgi:hypothetical protein
VREHKKVHPVIEKLWLRSILLSRIAAYLAAVLVAAPYIYHLARGSTAYLGLLEDDYFYYATVANNLISLGKLTYDGTTLTNGFHPLWLGVVVLVRWLYGSLGPAFYATLAAILIASSIATFELGRRCARLWGASPPLAATAAAVYSVGYARLMTTGMECIVAVPLFMWWLLEISRPDPLTPRRVALLGFIASLAILARLDVAIAVAMAIAGYLWLVRPKLPVLARQLAAFAAGGLLIPVYAAANLYYFNSAVPVSALAKRLVVTSGFNFNYARAVALWTYMGPTIGVVLPLGAVALYLLIRRDSTAQPRGRFVGGLTLAFAFVFYLTNALSGWIFFGWYAYPLPAATIAALVFICQYWGPLVERYRLRTAAVALMLALVVVVPLNALRYYRQHGPQWSVSDNTLLAAGYDIADHVRERNGLFAMGAVAGVVQYVTNKPFLQLEGIITDRAMVEHVRNQDELGGVLREYQADYLVVSFVGIPPDRLDGCYLITQPSAEWAGQRTSKMRGRICSEPVERFVTRAGTNPWSIFPNVETLIWDMKQAQWAANSVSSAQVTLNTIR